MADPVNEQLDLVSAVMPASLARNDDPATSKIAAFPKRGTMKRAILEAFALHGPMTDDELCAVPGLRHYPSPSVKTARSAMSRCRPPLLVSAGTERLSTNGYPMIVWRRAP